MANEKKPEEKKGLILPDTSEIDTRALSAVNEAKALSITNRPSYEKAAQFLLVLKEIHKAIDEAFDPIIRANHNAWKVALASKAKHAEPVEEAERIVKLKMVDFQKLEEKRLREEEERLRREAIQAEEEERLREAERLINEGRDEEALILLEGKPPAPPPVVLHEAPAPRVKGIVTREVWKFRISDETKIPREYLVPDLAKIGRVVRATCGRIEIPGVETYMEKEIAAGVKR